MNEQAQQALANLLSMAVDGLNGAVEFSKAQLPEVVEQLLMWHMAESLISFVLGILFMVAFPWGMFKVHKAIQEEKIDDVLYAIAIPLAVAGFSGGFVATAEGLEWLKIMIAPKLYLLEYAAQLVK